MVDALMMGYYYVFAWIIPGMAIVILFNIKKMSFLELFSLGCMIGYCYNIGLYYILYPWGGGHLTGLVIPLLGCASVAVLIIRKKQLKSIYFDNTGFIICAIFLFFILLIRFFAFDMDNLLPISIPMNIYYQDILFWIGDAASLGISYPPTVIRMDGLPHQYHYFSSIHMTIMNAATDVSLVKIGFSYQYIVPSILSCFGAYILAKRLMPKNTYVIAFMFILFFLLGDWELALATYGHHMFTSTWSFNIAVAISLFLFYLMSLQFEIDELDIKLAILSIMVFGILLGIKAPNAVVFLAGLGVLCAYWLFVNKQVKKSLVYGIGCLAMFLAIYFSLFSVSGATDGAFNWFAHLIHSPPGGFYQQLLSNWIPTGIAQFLTIIQWLIWYNRTTYVLFFIGMCLSIYHWRKTDSAIVLSFFISFAGILCTILFFHHGFSNGYYVMASYPFAILFGVYMIYKNKDAIFTNKTQKVVIGTVLSLCVLSGLVNAYNYYMPSMLNGYRKVRYHATESWHHNATSFWEHPNAVTQSDYEAFVWLKDNSPKDALVAGDRFLMSSQNTSFIISAFTERQTYLEGFGFTILSPMVNNDEVFRRRDVVFNVMGNDSTALNTLRKESVSYILRTKWLHPNFECPDDMGKLVFENESVAIYFLYPY